MPRPKQRTPELRAQVLSAALRLLETEGAAGFTGKRVAEGAQTSVPAVYELFGDKAGLARAMFFQGFVELGEALRQAAPATAAPRLQLDATLQGFRHFARARPALTELMFSRPVATFDPGAADLKAAASVRQHFVGLVERASAAGLIEGDAIDVAHVLLALAQGLALQEAGGWLGTSRASIDRRWRLAVQALVAGLAPAGPARPNAAGGPNAAA